MIKKRNKKASSNVVFPTIIFIILNLAFFTMLLIFVSRAGSGSLVYEQAYAKQIALLVDEARPDMEIFLNMTQGIEIAEQNNKNKNEIVRIEFGEVKVDLVGKGGYSFRHFSNYKISTDFDEEKNILKIIVKK